MFSIGRMRGKSAHRPISWKSEFGFHGWHCLGSVPRDPDDVQMLTVRWCVDDVEQGDDTARSKRRYV